MKMSNNVINEIPLQFIYNHAYHKTCPLLRRVAVICDMLASQIPVWSDICCVAQANLENIAILLPRPPKYYHYNCIPPHLTRP